MLRHAKPRIYVGPKTNEVVVYLGRSYNTKLQNNESIIVRMEFIKSNITDPVTSEWSTYVLKNDEAHFNIPDEFMSNITDFPKGFYTGKLYVDDCHIDDIELVKAPGHYASDVQSISDTCHGDSLWVEPECIIDDSCVTGCGCSCNGNVLSPCNCDYAIRNNCPTCYDSTYVSSVQVLNDYIDWGDDLDVEGVCTTEDVTPVNPESTTCSEIEAASCTQVTTTPDAFVGVQVFNDNEGYTYDDDDNDC